MSMTIGGIGGAGGIDPYEAYRDRMSGQFTAEDVNEMADAVDFPEDPDNAAQVNAVQPVENNQPEHARIEPAEQSEGSNADGLRRDLSHVMDDMMDIQGSLWGFSLRRVTGLSTSLS